MAIDRKATGKVVFGGSAARLHAALAGERWYDKTSVKCTPYDRADATKIVRAAGSRTRRCI